jgi:tRNA (mo5U34)-methyltransferase
VIANAPPLADMGDNDPAALAREIERLGPWFHNMTLAGIPTAPDHFLGDYPRLKWLGFAHAIPEDLSGKTVLDIGCNAGFYAIEMNRRGARRVVGIDADPRYLEQAALAARVAGAAIELHRMDVYDVASLREKFDYVFFLGVLYHLRHPLLALDLVREHVVGHTMVFQSMQRGSRTVSAIADDFPFEERAIFADESFPRMHFIEKSYSHDATNWWIPNRACVEAMLRSAGFHIAAHPEEEVYLCTLAQGQAHPDSGATKLRAARSPR